MQGTLTTTVCPRTVRQRINSHVIPNKMADTGYSSQTVSSTNLEAVEQSQSQYRSDEEDEDEKVLEVSKNKRWNKMATPVSSYGV